jgi:hypothetical protein
VDFDQNAAFRAPEPGQQPQHPPGQGPGSQAQGSGGQSQGAQGPGGQYPGTQYPAGQYPAGQYPAGQYPAGQYPAGPYQPGQQYQPGQYPPAQPYPQAQPYPGQPYPGPYPGQPYPGQPFAQAKTSYGRCVLASLIWAAVVVVLVFATMGAPGESRALGYLFGTLLFPSLLAALITWLFFRRKQVAFWLLVLASLPSFGLLWLVLGAARLAGRA